MYTKKELEKIKNTDDEFAWTRWQSAIGFNDGVKFANKHMNGVEEYCYGKGFLEGLESVIMEDLEVDKRIKSENLK